MIGEGRFQRAVPSTRSKRLLQTPMQPSVPSTDEIRARLAALLPDLRERYSVRTLSIFGSYARGEQTAESDLDLLVEFEKVPGLLTFVNMQHRLEDLLSARVDLATRPMIGLRLESGVRADLVAV